MENIFNDYYDEEGNLHIDARKPHKSFKVINLTANIKQLKNIPHHKLIIHHANCE